MEESRRALVVTGVLMTLIVTGLAYVLTMPQAATSVLLLSILVGGVFLGLLAIAVAEWRRPKILRITRRYSVFGPGYGFLQAMKQAVGEMDAIRARADEDGLTDDEGADLEMRVLTRLSGFTGDRRWRQVLRLKQDGAEEEAKRLARKIRSDHGF